MVKLIDAIEGVQRRATKMIPEIKKLSYPDRLKFLNLPTLAYRRARGDMIEVYKIVHNIYDINVSNKILSMREKLVSLRGHTFTLEHKRLYSKARINYFGNRTVNMWNSLPDHVVSADNLNLFKNVLDRLWSNQDILYNYRADIDKKYYIK